MQPFQFVLKLSDDFLLVCVIHANSIEEAEKILQRDFFKQHDFTNAKVEAEILTKERRVFQRQSPIIIPSMNGGNVVEFKPTVN